MNEGDTYIRHLADIIHGFILKQFELRKNLDLISFTIENGM